jgi:transcription elongation factor GreB
MGRWRPPSRRGSPYITADGAKALEDELHQLWKVERPAVTQVVHEAAKNGDRSENGDYIYGKRRLREIDSRVRFLSKRLEELQVVDQVPDNPKKVYFGAWITLEDEVGIESIYRIVGPDEFDLRLQKLSVDSPLARALLGKGLDDEVTFNSPEGTKHYVIVEIRYQR